MPTAEALFCALQKIAPLVSCPLKAVMEWKTFRASNNNIGAKRGCYVYILLKNKCLLTYL